MDRIIVVHPNRTVRALAAHILAVNGFGPIEAENVADAAAVIRADPPAVAIVDESVVKSPLRLSIPWVALGREAARVRLVKRGASCFIEKPFLPESLLRAVRWVLEVYPPAR